MTAEIIRIGRRNGLHGRVETSRSLGDDKNRIHQELNFSTGGGFMSTYLDKETFKQFDERITDKINDIKIDTSRIRDIDKTVYEMKSDLSHIKASTNTLADGFSSVKADIIVIKSSAGTIQQSIKDEFKTQKEELTAFRTEIKDEVISFKSTTMWAAIGVCATILASAAAIIIALI